MQPAQIFATGCGCLIVLVLFVLLVLDTRRNLEKMYPDEPESDDHVWILSSEVYLDHPLGGVWVRRRQGIYLDPQRAFNEFEKLMAEIDKEPLYNRAAQCERERLIK